MPATASSCKATDLASAIAKNVRDALAEDVGPGDLTAGLIDEAASARARIITREGMHLAGRPWADAVFRQLDERVSIAWQADDGNRLAAGDALCELEGPARALLCGERAALNFLQLLSAAATVTATFVAAVDGTSARILDTRKTLPGLRLAQKYAVRCGGGVNHRIGLFDAILIKENHIESAGGIAAAIAMARKLYPDWPIEIEVEDISGVRESLAGKAESLLLDNFPLEELRRAVDLNRTSGNPPAELEASGGISLDNIRAIAETGVDYISVGALTKNVTAIDLSMRFF